MLLKLPWGQTGLVVPPTKTDSAEGLTGRTGNLAAPRSPTLRRLQEHVHAVQHHEEV